MAAQHLAATKIQGAIRRFLYKKHRDMIRMAKRTGRPVPYYLLIPEQTRKMLIAMSTHRDMASISAT
jgi:hypothetical protein